jgi:hypothetical protein
MVASSIREVWTHTPPGQCSKVRYPLCGLACGHDCLERGAVLASGKNKEPHNHGDNSRKIDW